MISRLGFPVIVPVVGLADFTNGFHDQHLLSMLLSLDDPKRMEEGLRWVNFGRRLQELRLLKYHHWNIVIF